MSINLWMGKQKWYVCITEYSARNLAIKRNEIRTHSPTWMNQENMLRSQTQKNKYYVIPFLWNVQQRQIYRHRRQWLSAAGGGKKWRELRSNHQWARSFSVDMWWKCFKGDCGDDGTVWWIYQEPLKGTLQASELYGMWVISQESCSFKK